MALISITDFALQFPRVSARLLPTNAAQTAINCRVTNGKLKSFFGLLREAAAVNDLPLSIYRQRETGGWLDWSTDVNVIRSPLDTTPDTLIYTGDGRPKIRAVGSSTEYDLGLPAPLVAPTVAVDTEGNSGNIANVSRRILATATLANSVNWWTVVPVTTDGESSINIKTFSVNTHVHVSGSSADTETLSGTQHIMIKRFASDPNEGEIGEFMQYGIGDLAGQPAETYTFTYDPAEATFDSAISDWLTVDTPSAGTYYYLIVISTGLGLYFSFSGGSATQNYTLGVEVRVNNRTRVTSETDHELVIDSRVQFAGIVGTGVMPATMNLNVFTVAEIIDSKTFDISAIVEGGYTSGGTWSQYWTSGDVESRAYRYTYVATINGVDYEGPASEASIVIDAGQGQPILVNGFAAFPGDWNSPADRIRIYRFAAVTSTTGQYQLVAEILLTEAEYVDVILGESLGESLPDPDREPPPEDLAGLIELPNGGAAGFVGKTVYLAIPNQLHAWPLDYALSAHEEVVAIGAFGSSVAIATKGQPYIITGAEPGQMTMDRLELSQPCLSKRGCVDFGYAWTYPTDDGLNLVATGRAEIVTLGLFTKEEWTALNPSSFVAARYDGQYVCFYETVDGEKGGFMLDPLAPQRGVNFLDFWANAVWTDPSTGDLYVAQGNLIKKFDASPIELDKVWRSKDFSVQRVTMTAAKVDAKKYPIHVSIICDGEETGSMAVYSRAAFRVPPAEGEVFAIEVRGAHEIESVLLGENMGEIGRWQGGA